MNDEVVNAARDFAGRFLAPNQESPNELTSEVGRLRDELKVVHPKRGQTLAEKFDTEVKQRSRDIDSQSRIDRKANGPMFIRGLPGTEAPPEPSPRILLLKGK